MLPIDHVASFPGHRVVQLVPINSTCRYQLHSLMKEMGTFANFYIEKALLMGKRGLFMLVCPVECIYLGVNVYGCKPSKRLTGYLWFSDDGNGSWKCDVREGCQGPKLASRRFVNLWFLL